MYIKRNRFLCVFLILILTSTLLIGCSTNSNEDDITSGRAKVGVLSNIDEGNIEVDKAMDIIEELISDKYKGRLTGTEENLLAAKYIAQYFGKIGLENPKGLENYMQYYSQVTRLINSAPKLKIIDSSGRELEDFHYLSDFVPYTYRSDISTIGEVEGTLYTINSLLEYTNLEAESKGSILLIDKDTMDKIHQRYGANAFFDRIMAPEREIKGIIVEKEKADDYFLVAPNSHPSLKDNNQIGPVMFHCSTDAFKILSSRANGQTKVQMKVDFSYEDVTVPNVIGLIPGTDEELKDEFIILTAHMDHVGDNKNGTYNPGALDNASGTAAIMEIARVIKENEIQPKKSILFIAFNGEEEGLWGSRHYASNPIYPLDKSVVINLDMVGSKNVMPLLIGAFGSNNTKLMNDLYNYGKELNISVEKGETPGGSDHIPFTQQGVDSVILIHYDLDSGYHTPNDTIDSVGKERLEEVIKLVLYYIDRKAY